MYGYVHRVGYLLFYIVYFYMRTKWASYNALFPVNINPIYARTVYLARPNVSLRILVMKRITQKQ